MIESSKIIEFLEKTKSTQANYQFIVLRDLIKHNVRSKDDLLETLNDANPKRPEKITWSNTPVFKVLENKNLLWFIIKATFKRISN